MPIANYTTTIHPSKSINEIEQILARHGVRSILKEYDDGPSALSFMIYAHGSPVNFRLPANWRGVFEVMRCDSDVPTRYRTEEQARRVAWRILKDWIRAQMALIEAGLSSPLEVFLPYAVTGDGRTLFQVFSEKPGFLLEAHYE